MKPPRIQVSFKSTEEELDLYDFFLSQSKKYGQSEYIKYLIKKDKLRRERLQYEKNLHQWRAY